jgi:hypothetical protein
VDVQVEGIATLPVLERTSADWQEYINIWPPNNWDLKDWLRHSETSLNEINLQLLGLDEEDFRRDLA